MPDKENVLRTAIHTAEGFNASQSLHFIIRESDLETAIKHDYRQQADLLLKKAALYANHTILLAKPTHFSRLFLDKEWGMIDYWGNGAIFENIKLISTGLTDKQLFDGVFTVLPDVVITESEPFDEDDLYSREEFNFSKIHHNRYGIDLSLSDPAVNRHIFEKVTPNPRDMSVFNVWLPLLTNLPLEILLKTRQDEGDSFQRFQYALQKFVAELDQIESEAVLKEVFQYVDYETRTFEAKMNALRKSRAMAAYQAIIGFSIMGLCFALPSEIAQVITGFVGAYQSKDFIETLVKNQAQVNDLKASDFYLPWLYQQKAK